MGLSTVQEPRVTANGSREKLWPPAAFFVGATSGQKVVWTTRVSWWARAIYPYSVLLTMRLSQGTSPPIPFTNGSPS